MQESLLLTVATRLVAALYCVHRGAVIERSISFIELHSLVQG